MATPPPGSAGAFSPELCGRRLPGWRPRRPPGSRGWTLRSAVSCAPSGTIPLQVRALCAISAGAALRFFGAAGDPAGFAEEVEYHGRRLAKLNLAPWQVLEALAEYPAPEEGRWQSVRDGLRLAVALGLHTAFYQVRESETQVFYGLFRAETEAAGLDALLRHSIEILARALRAPSRAAGADRRGARQPAGWAPRCTSRPARPWRPSSSTRNCAAGMPLTGRSLSGTARRWPPWRSSAFPRPTAGCRGELTLLDACAERCLAAVRRARMVRDLADREEQVRQLAGHLILRRGSGARPDQPRVTRRSGTDHARSAAGTGEDGKG